MRVPFSVDQFFEVFARYNARVWPMQLVLLALAWVVAGLAVRSRRSRLVTGSLAALWLWMAVAYHLAFFAALTPAAYLFAALFLVEAALLAWHGLHTRRLHLAVPHDRTSAIVGGVLFAYALLGYPLLAYLAGQRYPAVPTFGVPCPTVIFTFGVLTWCLRPVPRSVLVVPVLWALLGVSAATSLGVVEDVGLPIAALLALAVILRPLAHRPHHEPPARRPIQLGF